MTAGAWPVVLPGRLERGVVVLNVKRLATLTKGRKDCDLEIIIERKHATRSHAQNALYWGLYVKLLSDYTGFTPDEMHEVLKAKFLPKQLAIADPNGDIKGEFTIGTTTTRLNKIEFGEYLRSIQQWAAEDLSVVIPDPDEAFR
jgi:hypothetical protein